VERVLQHAAARLRQLTPSVRANAGLVVVTLKLLLVIDASDVVTCIDVDAIKNLKRASECEVIIWFSFLVRIVRNITQVLVFCDSMRQEHVQKQGLFGKMVHSPSQKSSKSSAQVQQRGENDYDSFIQSSYKCNTLDDHT
jgi:hypothetical protein